MEIKFESNDDLPLSKTFNIPDMIIVVTSVLEKKKGNIILKFFYMNAVMREVIRMLEHEKIDASEGIDTNETSTSK